MMKPVIMGGLMGVMMMWMLHGMLTGSTMAAGAMVGFVAAHVVISVGVGLIFWLGARMSPRMQRLLARLHRPNIRHFSAMMGSAVVVAAAVHLIVHGGFA